MKTSYILLIIFILLGLNFLVILYPISKLQNNVKGISTVEAQAQPQSIDPEEPYLSDQTDVKHAVEFLQKLVSFGAADEEIEASSSTQTTSSSSSGSDPSSVFGRSREFTNPLSQEEVERCLGNKTVYQQAEAVTGVSWFILAGIHYREGNCGSNKSLRSGRTLGDIEPDIPGCAPLKKSIGECTFNTLLESAIDTGKLLKSKAVGEFTNSPEIAVLALSNYNGGGNRNCNKGVPYSGPCPPPYRGHDDPYAMNLFDEEHQSMYIIYCGDHQKCNPPKKDSRPGTFTVARIISTAPSP